MNIPTSQCQELDNKTYIGRCISIKEIENNCQKTGINQKIKVRTRRTTCRAPSFERCLLCKWEMIDAYLPHINGR